MIYIYCFQHPIGSGHVKCVNYARDGFGPGPTQSKSARAYIPTRPKVGPGHTQNFGPNPSLEMIYVSLDLCKDQDFNSKQCSQIENQS